MARTGAREQSPHDDGIVATFAANLKAARLRMGLSQTELGQAAGLLQQYISLIETGQQNVTLTTADTLAKVVKKDLPLLLTRPRRQPRKR